MSDGSMKYTLVKIYALDLYYYNAVSPKKMFIKCLGNSLNWSASSLIVVNRNSSNKKKFKIIFFCSIDGDFDTILY